LTRILVKSSRIKLDRFRFSLPERYLTPTYSEGSLVAANVGTVTTYCFVVIQKNTQKIFDKILILCYNYSTIKEGTEYYENCNMPQKRG